MNAFTPRAQQVLALARKEADRWHHNYVGTEHLLLGFIKLRQGVAVTVLQKMGLDLETIRMEVEKQIERSTDSDVRMSGNIPYTPRVKKVLALASKESKSLCHDCVGTGHILLGLLIEGEGLAGRVLKSLSLDIDRTRIEVGECYKNVPSQPSEAKSQVSEAIMRGQFTPQAQEILVLARKEAHRLKPTVIKRVFFGLIPLKEHYVDTEHLLLGILKLGQGSAYDILIKLGIQPDLLRAELEKQTGSSPDIKISENLPYSHRVKKVLALASKTSRELRHNHVDTEHILVGILGEKDGVAARVLKNFNIDTQSVLKEMAEKDEHQIAVPIEEIPRSQNIPYTTELKNALARTFFESKNLDHNHVGIEHFLLALLHEPNGVLVQILKKLLIDPEKVHQEILERLKNSPPPPS